MSYKDLKKKGGRPAGVSSSKPKPETLGFRLRQVRESAGKTIDSVASEMSVGKASQGDYELNKRAPDADYLQGFCLKYGVSADWLLLGVGDQVAGDRAPLPYDQEKMAFAMEVANSMAAAKRLPPGKSAAEWATEMYEFFVKRS